jgi:hypothetical protein
LQPPSTDHFPIVTILELLQDRVKPSPSWNFRMVDWESFTEGLAHKLEAIPPPTDLNNKIDVQTAARDLTFALQKTIEEHIQVSKFCPHSKQWWNSDLQALKKKLNKLSTEMFRQRAISNHPSYKLRKLAAKEYGKAILEAKKKHCTDFLEEAFDRDLWTTNRYLKDSIGDGEKSRIPTLKVKNEDGTLTEIASNAEKAEIFHKIFFPPKPTASSVPASFQYLNPLPTPPVIGLDQIR